MFSFRETYFRLVGLFDRGCARTQFLLSVSRNRYGFTLAGYRNEKSATDHALVNSLSISISIEHARRQEIIIYTIYVGVCVSLSRSFLWNYYSFTFLVNCFGELWPTFERVIALLPDMIIWLITLKLLHLEYFVPICCSATFSTATTWSVVWKCISIA